MFCLRPSPVMASICPDDTILKIVLRNGCRLFVPKLDKPAPALLCHNHIGFWNVLPSRATIVRPRRKRIALMTPMTGAAGLQVSRNVFVPEGELEERFVRSGGPGGQNVNKVSTAIHLRFDVTASNLPEAVKSKLLGMRDARINTDGVIVIKAQKFRSQEKNKLESLKRLDELLQKSQYTDKPRRKTRPSRSAVRKRLDSKKKQGSIKKNRGKVDDY